MFGSRIKILTDGTENLVHAQTVWMLQLLIFHQKAMIFCEGPQTVQYANTGSAATVLLSVSLRSSPLKNLIGVKRVSC